VTKLSVNVNKIALLRNSRTIGIPDVRRLAAIALDAGAHGITVHPRPDGRHIRSDDVYAIAELVGSRPDVEFNIEGNPFHQVMDLVRAVRPHQCTLVPDDPAAFTSDHGWDLKRHSERLIPVIAELRQLGVRVSLFMDPEPETMALARQAGADRIELYTEPYAKAWGTPGQHLELERYSAAAEAAREAGMAVNAGHDLNLDNLARFLRTVDNVAEVSIGHALTADALEMGMATAVKTYLGQIREGAAKS
jgi:pyridoxine 5-phosphate synthase